MGVGARALPALVNVSAGPREAGRAGYVARGSTTSEVTRRVLAGSKLRHTPYAANLLVLLDRLGQRLSIPDRVLEGRL